MATEPAKNPAPPVVADPPKDPAPHIRTFAKDMARLGKTPPPMAVAPAPKKKKEKEKKKEAPKKTPLPEPEPPSLFPKAPSTDETKEEVLARLKAKAAKYTAPKKEEVSKVEKPEEIKPVEKKVPAPPPPEKREVPRPATPPTPPPAKSKAPAVPDRIHTYKSDFSDHIDANQASTFSVVAAEADAGRLDTVRFVDKKPFPFAVMFGALFVIAGVGVLFAALSLRPLPVTIPEEVSVPSLVRAQEYREISGEGSMLQDALAGLTELPLAEGTLAVAYKTRASSTPEGLTVFVPISGGELVDALALPAPDILLRSLLPESTVGVMRIQGETAPFFLLRTASYERSFAGMLAWEARIATDLSMWYAPLPPTPEPTGTSTLPTVVRTPASQGFRDIVIEARDARVLRDQEGRAILVYGYHDKETLIIARNEASFAELVRRLLLTRSN